MTDNVTNQQSSWPGIESIIKDSQEVLDSNEKLALEGLISAQDRENTWKETIKTCLEDEANKLLTVEWSEAKVNIKTFLDTLKPQTVDKVLISFSWTKDKWLWSRDNYRWHKDENIALIQLYLCSIGEIIAIDGILGPETEWALKKYWKQDQGSSAPEDWNSATEQSKDQVYTFTLDDKTKRDDANFDGKETTVTIQGDGDLHIKNDTIDTTCQKNADGTYTLTIDQTIYQIKYDKNQSKLTWSKAWDANWNQTIQLTQPSWTEGDNQNIEATDQWSKIKLGWKDFIVMKDNTTKTYTKIKYENKSVDITSEKAELGDIDWRTYTFDLTSFDGTAFGNGKVMRSKEYTVDDKKISLTESNKADWTFAIKSATYNKIDASISGDVLTFADTNKKTTTQFKPTRDKNQSDYTITLISETKWPFGDTQTAYSIQKTKDDKDVDVYKFIQWKDGFDMTIESETQKATFTTNWSTTNTKYIIDNFDYNTIDDTMQIWKEMANEQNPSNLNWLKIGEISYNKYQTYQGRDGDIKVICSDGSNPPQTKEIIFSKNTDNTFDPINIYDATIVDSNCINANWFGDALKDTDDKKTSLVDTDCQDITLLPSTPPTTNYHGTLVWSNSNSYTFTAPSATVYDLSKTDLAGFGWLLTVSGSGANQTLMFQWYTSDSSAKTLQDVQTVLKSGKNQICAGNDEYEIEVNNNGKICDITQSSP
jgi:hypothetical protein